MFKIRREHMEAFRPVVRAQLPSRILTDLRKRGARAERDPGTGAVIVRDARGFETRVLFYPDGLPARLTQPSGATHAFEHDDQGRLTALIYPGGERLEMKRDLRGNVAEFLRPGLPSYQFNYDENDRLLSARYPDGTSVRLTYHPEGLLNSLTDRTGATTQYRREPGGKLRAIVDPLGHETIYETDEEGRLAGLLFPDGSTQRYFFDSETQKAIITQRDGGMVSQELDQNGRLKVITWSDGSRTEFEFNDVGKIVAARCATGEIVFTFDTTSGKPLTETTGQGTISYAYDPDGRLIRITTPLGESVTYEYDNDGRLVLIRDWEGRENFITYSNNGTISEIRFGNGMVEKQQNARAGRLLRATILDQRGRAMSEQVYQYDLNEQLTWYSQSWGDSNSQRLARKIKYDPEGRILAETDADSNRPVVRYEYDQKGNLVTDNSVSIDVGPLDQPTRYGEIPIQYDNNGNITNLPGIRGEIRCSFSADGTLRDLSTGGRTLRFEYDALGRRISKTDGEHVWTYGWAGFQLLWEEFRDNNGSEALRRDYLFFPNTVAPVTIREGKNSYWLCRDTRGAVIQAFDSLGSLVWRANYDPFGLAKIEVNKIQQPWRLAGQYEDAESGLFFNVARYYSPQLKVYLSRDPFWQKHETSNYGYALNNPWNRFDPLGAFGPLIALGIGALIGAGIALINGQDPVQGAVDGALLTAGALLVAMEASAALLAGTLIVAGMGVISLADSLTGNLMNGDSICFSCAIHQAVASMERTTELLLEGAVLGLVVGKIVAPALGSIATRLAAWTGDLLAPVEEEVGQVAKTLSTEAEQAVEAEGEKVTQSIGDLRSAGLKDAHHVIQDAAVRDIPGYNTNSAPGVQLPGPSTAPGTPHYSATQAQRLSGGGTYGAERTIGYNALRAAGYSDAEATQAIREADEYFKSLGVTEDTPTRIPGNRR